LRTKRRNAVRGAERRQFCSPRGYREIRPKASAAACTLELGTRYSQRTRESSAIYSLATMWPLLDLAFNRWVTDPIFSPSLTALAVRCPWPFVLAAPEDRNSSSQPSTSPRVGYAAKCSARMSSNTPLKVGSGARHMVRYVSRKGSQIEELARYVSMTFRPLRAQ
jgi:hypothetical protein